MAAEDSESSAQEYITCYGILKTVILNCNNI